MKSKQGELHFYFTELNTIPKEFKKRKLNSKGFFPEATLHDFPIRGKNVFLNIIRRRWLNESTKKIVTRDWQFVTKGNRITSEFATFLKKSISNNAISTSILANFLGVNSKNLQRQYKDYLSDFKQWNQKTHAKN